MHIIQLTRTCTVGYEALQVTMCNCTVGVSKFENEHFQKNFYKNKHTKGQ